MPRDIVELSKNEQDFILEALREDLRIDNRKPFDYRSLQVAFGE